MINYLKFDKLDNIELIDLTNNTIVLFNTREALAEFKQEFEKLIDDINYEFVSFSTDNESENIKIEKLLTCRDITGIYNINCDEQRFIFTVEPMSIFAVKSTSDLWLVDKDDTHSKWNCFSFDEYEGYERFITNEQIYKFVCESKYCNLDK